MVSRGGAISGFVYLWWCIHVLHSFPVPARRYSSRSCRPKNYNASHIFASTKRSTPSSSRHSSIEDDDGITPETENGNAITIHHPKALPRAAGFMFLLESFRGRTHHYLTRLMNKHGDNVIIWNKYVIINDVDAIRDVVETFNLEKTPEVKRGYRSMFYQKGGILAAPWEQWKVQRRMTAPALAKSVIGDLAPKFELGARPILQKIEKSAVSGTILEMDQLFTALGLDTIGLVLLGSTFGIGHSLLVDDETTAVPFSEALKVVTREAITQMTLPSALLSLLPIRKKVQKAKQVIDTFLEDCISERIQEREHGMQRSNNNQTDMMNILLDAESTGSITRDDTKGQLLTFLFAGHDTTAHTLSWLLYEVSLNTTLQQALYNEAKEALPSREAFPMDSNIIDSKLPLLDRVWQETNRKHPAAATGTLRQVGPNPLVLRNGLELPAGVSVLIPPFSLHRNEKYWPDPEVFDPGRFDEDACRDRDPMTFQAFSSGPRSCIGARLARAEAMSVMACILRRFEVTCVEEGEVADYCDLTRRPLNGIRFQFATRL